MLNVEGSHKVHAKTCLSGLTTLTADELSLQVEIARDSGKEGTSDL